jgi:glucosamine--fructose-6-phosphate aminotransferase (isomerizing)
VITTAGDAPRFSAALQVIEVPSVDPDLAFVLAAMAGHLFGYEAALSIDAQARSLREVRGVIEDVVNDGPHHVLERIEPRIQPLTARFFDDLRSGSLNGHLEASTASRLASLLRYAAGMVPLDLYEAEHGKVGTPATVVDDLTHALTRGIEELTRPIDAIKHQAKTVTVGISRSEDELLEVPLVAALLAAGSPRDRLSYRALKTLAALDAAVSATIGFTRYRVDGQVVDRTATLEVIDKGGVATQIRSRADGGPVELQGTKHRAAEEREVTVVRGLRDGRTIVMVPETKDGQVTGLTLLHVDFEDPLAPPVARRVLEGYRNRYNAIVDAVTETEPRFDDSVLGTIPTAELLVLPVHFLAERWRHAAPGT